MINILMNSARKKNANFIPEYSVWNPAVSSDSASARSNGPLLISAVLATRKIIKAINAGICPENTNHPQRCASTISESCMVPANTTIVITERPTESS